MISNSVLCYCGFLSYMPITVFGILAFMINIDVLVIDALTSSACPLDTKAGVLENDNV